MRQFFKLRLTIALILLAAFALVVGRGWQSLRSAPNDFIPLYVAGGLATSPELYDEEPYRAFLSERYRQDVPALRYSRPPFYALALAPFTSMSFESARLAFSILKLAAIALVVALWTFPSRKEALWAVLIALPLWMSFVAGQDVPFALLALVAGGGLVERRPAIAGAVLSLCAIKFHLFLTLPVWLLHQDRRPIAKGFAGGALTLVALSFLQQGADWPMRYAATLLNPAINPSQSAMPNLHGMLQAIPGSDLLELLITAAVLWFCWRATQNTEWRNGLAVCLVGGLLISRHAYLSDLAVLIPAILILLHTDQPRWLIAPIALLLVPIPLLMPTPWPLLVQASLAVSFVAVVSRQELRSASA